MHRFWKNIIEPIAESIQAKRLLEIGAWTGLNTKNLLAFCQKHQGHLDIIDPYPLFEEAVLKEAYPDATYQIHQALSLEILPNLEAYDLALIDGDHNWYTVYHELLAIEKTYQPSPEQYPILIFHDINWPYAKRDLYYNPKNIPDQYLHAHKKAGIAYDKATLDNHYYFNAHLDNAMVEGGEKNGVLTAIEDFIAQSTADFEWLTFPLFHGLGVLISKTRLAQNKTLQNTIDKCLKTPKYLGSMLEDIEKIRAIEVADLYHQINQLQQENQQLQAQLTSQNNQAKPSLLHKAKNVIDRLRPVSNATQLPKTTNTKQLEDDFLNYFYNSYVWYKKTSWLGVGALKNPFDLWIYQELIVDLKPDYIIETGTYKGGSAFYMASICDWCQHGQIISIDIEAQKPLPQHPRIEYIEASSTDDFIIDTLKNRTKGKKVIIILDSDHSERHVRKELEKYHSLVPVGSYLVVEDTIVNGHPILPDFGSGPMEATQDFLKSHPEFVIDKSMEKFFMTFNRDGFLKRIK